MDKEPRIRSPQEQSVRVADLFDGALNWLVLNERFFDPFRNSEQVDYVSFKSLAELASFCADSRQRGPNHDQRIESLVERTIEILHTDEYTRTVDSEPKLFVFAVLTLDSLNRASIPVESRIPRMLQGVIDRGYVTATERTPTEAMQLRLLLESGRFSHGLQSVAALYPHTLLAKRPPLEYWTENDAYDVTHAVFVLWHDPEHVPISGDEITAIRGLVVNALDLFLQRRHWDLVAELLQNCLTLGLATEPRCTEAWRALREAQAEDGAIPGPTGQDLDFNNMAADEKQLWMFRQSYHTTLEVAAAADAELRGGFHRTDGGVVVPLNAWRAMRVENS